MKRRLLFMVLILWALCATIKAQYIQVGDTVSSGIVYKNIRDTMVPAPSMTSPCTYPDTYVDIDFDGDNTKDVRFTRTYSWNCPGGHFGGNSQLVKSLNNIEFSQSLNYYADTIAYNAVLDNSYSWAVPTNSFVLRFFSWSIPNNSGTGGQFLQNNKYLGFRKILPYDTLYGWFLLDDLNGNLTIKSYAYKRLYLGVHELDKESANLAVYPNPAKEFVFIESPVPLSPARLSVTDCTGRSIRANHSNVSGNKLRLDVSTFPPGVYFIELRNEASILRRKLVVSK